jgi:hypothetical protein
MVSISDRKKAATHWNCGVGIRCQILFRFYHDGVSLDSAQSVRHLVVDRGISSDAVASVVSIVERVVQRLTQIYNVTCSKRQVIACVFPFLGARLEVAERCE